MPGSSRFRVCAATVFEQIEGVHKACSAAPLYSLDRRDLRLLRTSEFGLAMEHFDFLDVLREDFLDKACIDVQKVDIFVPQILI